MWYCDIVILLTSYDMDCDIIADAKCGPASVPINRYVSHSIVDEEYKYT